MIHFLLLALIYTTYGVLNDGTNVFLSLLPMEHFEERMNSNNCMPLFQIAAVHNYAKFIVPIMNRCNITITEAVTTAGLAYLEGHTGIMMIIVDHIGHENIKYSNVPLEIYIRNGTPKQIREYQMLRSRINH